MSARDVIVGVDVGGTFTDLFLLDAATGTFRTAKVPSHRGDEARGFLNGLQSLGGAAGLDSIVHGTTVGTNTLLERRGPRIGVITTRGFRDTLEMRRRDRRRTWGLWGDFIPIADRDLRIEVDERTLADGSIRKPVDPTDIRAVAKRLRDGGADAVAITFINAYANPENERRALAELRAVWPNEFVTASHEVLSEIREFERSSTAALNAYLQPVVASYLGKLEHALTAQSFPGRLHIVQSNGGIMSTATARRLPVRTALSGPAAGVVASAALAKAAGFDNLITCDLGGTSFDVSLIANGKVAVAAQTTIDFGLVIRTPMIEITTIGAGGGSIAWVDRGGLLQVGPESAGSVPGPACYGAGNTRPTLTDAQVVLGRINAARPLGGELKSLDVAAARNAIAEHVGTPLKLEDRGRRSRHRARRGSAHGRRHPARVHRARPRAVALRGDAVRRRRRVARRRAHSRDRPQVRTGAALPRHHLGARLRARRFAARRGADAQRHAGWARHDRARAADAANGQRGQRGHRRIRYPGRAHRRGL